MRILINKIHNLQTKILCFVLKNWKPKKCLILLKIYNVSTFPNSFLKILK